MLESIPSEAWTIGGTIGGVIIGFILNVAKDYYMQRPRLFYSLNIAMSEIEPEYRTKTSPSNFIIEICNYGEKPVLLNNISLYTNDGKIIVDALIVECTKILPYEKYDCCLAHQDYMAIQRYCDKSKQNSCKVIACTVNNQRIKGFLDLFMLTIRSGRKNMVR